MFTNASAQQINVKVVVYGVGIVGKSTLMQRVHQDTPQDQKGEMISIDGADRTLFFDLARPDFGDVGGSSLRLHLYTLPGQVTYEASYKLIVKNADAIVFVADAQRERQEANLEAYERLEAHLREWDLAPIPRVFCVTKCDFDNAEPPGTVVASLASGVVRAHRVNPTTGDGIAALMEQLVVEVKRAIADGRVKEWRQSPEEARRGLEFTARARLVGHYAEHFGETAGEYNLDPPIEDRPGLIVVEHEPAPGRAYWTYATAGLSLWEQVPEGPERRLEFLAYSPRQSQGVVDLLMMLTRQIQLLDETDAAYSTFDTVTLPGMGLLHDMFVLAPPLEDEAMLAFPDLARRSADVRFTHAITGNVEDTVEVTFIHVVPVLPDELELATREGTPVLLQRMKLDQRGRDFGWGRRKSVLARKLFGLF